MKNVFLVLLTVFMNSYLKAQNTVMVIGHRGCRGELPENSIESFKEAIISGADGIEWDVVVNGENKIVVSHEPYFHRDFCSNPDGSEITDEGKFNIYKMNQNDIEAFDCGTKVHPNFKDQLKLKSKKPLLSEVVKEIPGIVRKPIFFEIKSESKEYEISQPKPAEFVQIVLSEMNQYNFKHVLYMSFDPAILEELHAINPSFKLVLLMERKGFKAQLSQLSFLPSAVGVYHKLLSPKSNRFLRSKNLGIYAWTVNEIKDAHRMMDLGVDGIITDYPKRVIQARGSYRDH